jgi:opacity protein-like surface antigen
LNTDGRIAVLELNDCRKPNNPVDLEAPPDQPATGNVVERGFRQGILITRNDIYRGNLIYQGYEGTKFGIEHLKHKGQTHGHDLVNDEYSIALAPGEPSMETEPPAPELLPRSSRPFVPETPVYVSPEEKAPFIELGVEGGWLRFGDTLSVTNLALQSRTPEIPSFTLLAQNRLHNGYAIGTSVTLNTWKYFSNEFSFDYQRGKYRLGASFSGFNGQEPINYQEQTTGLLTNQFGYAAMANLRSRDKRFRPYVTAGLVLQLLHITDAPFKSSSGVFRVGLRNVGLILASYNFANHPPLDGGGVFQFGFQYGGGIKYRVARRWMARIDYRETVSPQPNFIERSIHVDDPSASDEFTIYKETNGPAGPLREQRLTGGVAFTF